MVYVSLGSSYHTDVCSSIILQVSLVLINYFIL